MGRPKAPYTDGKRQRRMGIISYHFNFEKEINIGQTTGYKQK